MTNAIPPAVWLVALPHTGLDPPFSSRVFCRWIIGWGIVRVAPQGLAGIGRIFVMIGQRLDRSSCNITTRRHRMVARTIFFKGKTKPLGRLWSG